MEVLIKVGTAGRGQIPIEIREKLGIKQGDTLIVGIERIIKAGDSF